MSVTCHLKALQRKCEKYEDFLLTLPIYTFLTTSIKWQYVDTDLVPKFTCVLHKTICLSRLDFENKTNHPTTTTVEFNVSNTHCACARTTQRNSP